jgi:hypothetical protein
MVGFQKIPQQKHFFALVAPSIISAVYVSVGLNVLIAMSNP